jgi:hypothetical protein
MPTSVGNMSPQRNVTFGLGGMLLVIAGTVILAVVLIFLQHASASPFARLSILFLINLFLGLPVLLRPSGCWGMLKRNATAVSLWSLAYCCGYGAFLVFPKQLPLGLFTIASALAPLLGAMPFSHREGGVRQLLFRGLPPLVILVLLGILEGGSISAHYVLPLFAFVLLSHSLLQYGMRYTSKETDPTLVTFMTSLFNAALLGAIIVVRAPSVLHLTSRTPIYTALIIAPLVLALQYFHLKGLHYTGPVAGALAMSSSVPISLLVEELSTRSFRPLLITISLIYIVIVTWRGSLDRGTTRTPDLADAV